MYSDVFLESCVCLLCILCHTFYIETDKLYILTGAFKREITIRFIGSISISYCFISNRKGNIDHFLL